MTVDVDISYINFGQTIYRKNGEYYEIFDIYNNGFEHGGNFKLIFNRYLFITKEGILDVTESNIYPKISTRKIYDDLTLRLGLHVRKSPDTLELKFQSFSFSIQIILEKNQCLNF